ncbi:MAG: PocR ligand-binding domain-containing protein, partial [Candidatus Peribacteraceae bacterium]|nr:PocR ligand-binding domain-containing protein [Candidatus Peribacteraceae bacterium]
MSILDDIDNKLLEDIMTIYSEISGHNMVLFKKGENIPIGPSEKINPFCKTIDEAGLTSLCMDDYLKRKQKVKGSASNTTCHAGLNNFIMSLDYKKDTLGHLVTGQTILAGSGEKPQKQFQKFIKRMINEQIVPEEVIETFKKEYGELDTSFDPMEYHNLLTNAKSVYDNLFKWMDIRNEKATVRDAFIVATAHHILTFIHSLLNSGKTLQTSLKSSEYNWVQDELLEETYRISLDLLKFIDFIQIEEVSPLDN